MASFFKIYSGFFPLIILAFIIAVSFGQSTRLHLWEDDNALIYKLQHPEEPVGFLGPGPLGLGAYRYIAVPYIPIYQLFGMNIPVLYLWAILFYFLASVSIFFLTKQLTKNNMLSILSGSIFAAGFIGSDGILRLFNSIQTSYSIIFVCLTFIFLHRFRQFGYYRYYILALLFFLVSLETAFIRTQFLVFPLIIFGLLFLARRRLFLLLPFLAIYYFIFSKNPDPRSQLLWQFMSGILNGQFQYLHGFLGSLGNIIIPGPLNNFLFDSAGKISLDYGNRLLILELLFLIFSVLLINFICKTTLYRLPSSLVVIMWFVIHIVFFHDQELIFRHSLDLDTAGVFANFMGGIFLIIYGVGLLSIQDKKKRLLLIFVLSWILFNILAYSVYLPFSPLDSIHRYLVHSFVAYAIFIPAFIYYLWDKRVSIIVASFIVFSNIWFSINYQNKFIIEKSIPTNKFYGELKKFIPNIPKGSVFYFDVANDEISQQQFRDFVSVAQMPDSAALAVRYGIGAYDVYISRDFAQLLEILEERATPLDLVFSFFYKRGHLVDTTQTLRKHLQSQGLNFDYSPQDLIDVPTVTPLIAQIYARVNLPSIESKYSCSNGITKEERRLFFDYFLSREDLRQRIKIQTSSQEKNQVTGLLTDGDPDTLWRGGRGWWHENEKETITIDLERPEEIGKLVWVNGYANSSPIDYLIEGSNDGEVWQIVKDIDSSTKKGNEETIFENFPTKKTRYLRMSISKTFDNDSPAIGEIEVVPNRFVNIDRIKASKLEQNLADCITNDTDLGVLREFLKKRGVKVSVLWKTNKHEGWGKENVRAFFVNPDGLYHRYEVVLPAAGTRLEEFRIENENLPTRVSISKTKFIVPGKDKLIDTRLK